MPSTNYKITGTFNQGDNGFSESWWASTTSSTDAEAKARAWGVARAAILGDNVTFEALTATPDPVIGGPRFFTTDCLSYPGAGLPSDEPIQGPLISIRATNRHHRSIVLRGFPDDWIVYDPATRSTVITPDGAAKVKAYLATWKTLSPFLMVQASERQSARGKSVLSLGPVTNRPDLTLVTTADPVPALDVFKPVKILGCRKTTRAAKGIHNVDNIPTLTTFTIDVPWGAINAYDQADITNVRALVNSVRFEAYVTLTMKGVRKRDPGRAFFVPRGRATARPR